MRSKVETDSRELSEFQFSDDLTRNTYLPVYIYGPPLNIVERSTTRVIPCALADTLRALRPDSENSNYMVYDDAKSVPSSFREGLYT